MVIDAALNPAEIEKLPQADLSETTCVVLDILRATSSMITAMANGTREIYPVCTIEDAFALAGSLPDALLAGERHGDPPTGFHTGNSPLEYLRNPGRRIIWTTTNGTIALRACERAARVLVGALLNLDAIASEVRRSGVPKVLLVCAGTYETLALEDVVVAGYFAAMFPEATLTDSARTALAVANAFPEPLPAFHAARNGRELLGKKRDAEVEWCARRSVYTIVGLMDGPVVRPIT
jgi:2-phosphosulfolactate phosphatase